MKKIIRFLILSFLLSSTVSTQAQLLVQTLAGDGPSIFYNAFSGVAVDALGNVYTTDFFQHRIRKITPNGVMTVFAGKGERGKVDGIGTDAQFDQPVGIAVDASGNVYVADQQNNVIRKITPDGNVTTFAGSGKIGHTDDIGILAEFASPSGVAVDASGNIYVADTGNNLIRKITPDGQVSTLAGSGIRAITNGVGIEASFIEPRNLTVDGFGNVYVAQEYLIRKITPDAIVTTFAGSGHSGNTNGAGSGASFHNIAGMTTDIDGNLYVADLYNNVIRKITPDAVVSTYIGTGEYGMANGLVTEATFGYPSDVTIDAYGNMYVSEDGNYLIRKITGKPTITPPVIPSTTPTTPITPTDPIVTGTQLYNSGFEMKLYPIPASNEFTLALTLADESDIRMELMNSEGSKVAYIQKVSQIGYQELTLSVQSLPAGMYVANIYSGSKMSSQKVVIIR